MKLRCNPTMRSAWRKSQNRTHGGANIAALGRKARISKLAHPLRPQLGDAKRLHPRMEGRSENANPASEGTTTSNASAASPP